MRRDATQEHGRNAGAIQGDATIVQGGTRQYDPPYTGTAQYQQTRRHGRQARRAGQNRSQPCRDILGRRQSRHAQAHHSQARVGQTNVAGIHGEAGTQERREKGVKGGVTDIE